MDLSFCWKCSSHGWAKKTSLSFVLLWNCRYCGYFQWKRHFVRLRSQNKQIFIPSGKYLKLGFFFIIQYWLRRMNLIFVGIIWRWITENCLLCAHSIWKRFIDSLKRYSNLSIELKRIELQHNNKSCFVNHSDKWNSTAYIGWKIWKV